MAALGLLVSRGFLREEFREVGKLAATFVVNS